MSTPHPATSSPADSIGWRGAKATSPWIAPGASADVTLTWTPGSFTTSNLRVNCLADEDSDIHVVGIRALTTRTTHVIVENRNPAKPQRGTIVCTAQQPLGQDDAR